MNLRDAEIMARELLAEYAPGWRFGWIDHKRTNGRCNHRTRTVELSRTLTPLRTEHAVRGTVMHEIAHTLTPGDGHGPKWKAQMRRFGLSDRYCSSDSVDVSLIAKYKIVCKVHGITGYAHRRSSVTKSCGRCSRKFNPDYLLRYVQIR